MRLYEVAQANLGRICRLDSEYCTSWRFASRASYSSWKTQLDPQADDVEFIGELERQRSLEKISMKDSVSYPNVLKQQTRTMATKRVTYPD
jgi:hypothetical protein